jgi:hypothetical protein
VRFVGEYDRRDVMEETSVSWSILIDDLDHLLDRIEALGGNPGRGDPFPKFPGDKLLKGNQGEAVDQAARNQFCGYRELHGIIGQKFIGYKLNQFLFHLLGIHSSLLSQVQAL